MNWSTILACILIVGGAGMMLVSIINHRRFVRAVSRSTGGFSARTSGLIRAHMIFMVFFFLAYLGVVYLFVHQIHVASDLFIGLIFFFGAIFVHIGIIIQKKAFQVLQDSNQQLQDHARELEASHHTLVCLNEDLQNEIEQKVKAQEADQLKSDFLSQVSHELRTPLTSIYGFAKLIQKDFEAIESARVIQGNLTRKQERISTNISIITSECSRLTRMVNNVLDLAKIESGQTEWIDAPEQLERVIRTSLKAVEGLAHTTPRVTLNVDIPHPLPPVTLDADLMTQVFVNLLSNALKFTKAGSITIRAVQIEQTIAVTVSDTGVGMTAENLNRIFDKYYIARSGNTLSASNLGTGLGLPICKQIVEHYGGEIHAESELGSGSTFTVTLPIERTDKDA